MPHKDKSTYDEYHRQYYLKNKAKIEADRKVYYAENKDKFIKAAKKHYLENKERHRDLARIRTRERKIELKNYFGGKCSCCGEKEMEFLTIDHVHENGAEERRANGKREYRSANDITYQKIWDLMKTGKPASEITDYQVLCFNCNCSKHYGKGICVHKRKTPAISGEGF